MRRSRRTSLNQNSACSPPSVSTDAFPDKQTIVDQVNAWAKCRNAVNAGADWRFTIADARIKLRSLYPST
jgi:hypothetical protein